jgi:hypothetical protein
MDQAAWFFFSLRHKSLTDSTGLDGYGTREFRDICARRAVKSANGIGFQQKGSMNEAQKPVRSAGMVAGGGDEAPEYLLDFPCPTKGECRFRY